MKVEFDLELPSDLDSSGTISIIGKEPDHRPYVAIRIYKGFHQLPSCHALIQDRDLERFAVNILKALKSKKLK